jgi:hypothetical protein
MVTEKGLFEFDMVTKQTRTLVDTEKSSQFIASSVSLGFGAYTIREKKKDGTYVYHIYDGDVIHDISSKRFFNRVDYCKSTQMVFFRVYGENTTLSMFTDMDGKPNINLSKRLLQDLIIIPVDQDPSFIAGFNFRKIEEVKTVVCARINKSGDALWEFPIDKGYYINTISVAPKRDAVVVIADHFIYPKNRVLGDDGPKLWLLRLSDGKILKEVVVGGVNVNRVSFSPSQEYAILFGGGNYMCVVRIPDLTVIREVNRFVGGFSVDDAMVTDNGEVIYYYRPFVADAVGKATINIVNKENNRTIVWEGEYIEEGNSLLDRVLVQLPNKDILFRRGNQVLKLTF